MKKIFIQFRFYIISVILVMAGIILFIVARHSKEQASREVLPVKAIEALPEFQVQDIAEIEISFGEYAVKLVHGSDVWHLYSPGKPVAIANPNEVLHLLEEISKAKLLRELSIETEEEAKALSLSTAASAQPQQTGCKVIIRDKSGNTVREMLLGKVHYSVGEQIGKYRANIPDGRYVRIMIGDKPHYFLMSNPMSTCTPLSAFWFNPIVCPSWEREIPVLIRYTDLKTGKPVWEVKLDGTEYKLNTVGGKKLDTKAMREKLAYLTKAPLSRDIAGDEVKFEPDSKLEIIYSNGFSYLLEMQNDDFDPLKRFGRLTPAYQPVRREKETDSAFEERKKQYQAELEREKKLFGGQIFVLRPALIRIFEAIPGK